MDVTFRKGENNPTNVCLKTDHPYFSQIGVNDEVGLSLRMAVTRVQLRLFTYMHAWYFSIYIPTCFFYCSVSESHQPTPSLKKKITDRRAKLPDLRGSDAAQRRKVPRQWGVRLPLEA